jgi:hypothetical protein
MTPNANHNQLGDSTEYPAAAGSTTNGEGKLAKIYDFGIMPDKPEAMTLISSGVTIASTTSPAANTPTPNPENTPAIFICTLSVRDLNH